MRREQLDTRFGPRCHSVGAVGYTLNYIVYSSDDAGDGPAVDDDNDDDEEEGRPFADRLAAKGKSAAMGKHAASQPTSRAGSKLPRRGGEGGGGGGGGESTV